MAAGNVDSTGLSDVEDQVQVWEAEVETTTSKDRKEKVCVSGVGDEKNVNKKVS